MKQILLIPVGSAGDVHPLLGVGAALKKRGHSVRVITTAHFEAVIRRMGFDFTEMGTEAQYQEAINNPDLWDPVKAFPLIAEQVMASLEPMYDVIKTFYVPGQTIVVAGTLAFGARVAQEKLGIPTATVHLQPAILRSAYDPPAFPTLSIPRWFPAPLIRSLYRLIDVIVDREFANKLNPFRKELGLPPVKRVMHNWIHSPQRTIGLFPDWFAKPQKDWPDSMVLTGFPLFDGDGVETLSPGVKEFLDAGEAPLIFTAGSAMKWAERFFKESILATQKLGRRAMILTQHSEQLPSPLPAGIAAFSYVPFGQIFRRAAAIVHHGGVGTTAQALKAGRPQLVVPFSHDQPDNGNRITTLDVGELLALKKYRADKVAETLSRMINDKAMQQKAQEISHRLDGEKAIQRTVDLIEQLG